MWIVFSDKLVNLNTVLSVRIHSFGDWNEVELQTVNPDVMYTERYQRKQDAEQRLKEIIKEIAKINSQNETVNSDEYKALLAELHIK